jgi:hypothetical protein
VPLPLITLLGTFTAPKDKGVWLDMALMATGLLFGLLLFVRARRRGGLAMWVSALAAFGVLGLAQPLTIALDNAFTDKTVRLGPGGYVYAAAYLFLIVVTVPASLATRSLVEELADLP